VFVLLTDTGMIIASLCRQYRHSSLITDLYSHARALRSLNFCDRAINTHVHVGWYGQYAISRRNRLESCVKWGPIHVVYWWWPWQVCGIMHAFTSICHWTIIV